MFDKQEVSELIERGAHFVLCDQDKAAFVSGWQKPENAPSAAAVMRHAEGGGLVGIIPASLGLICVDVDEGDHQHLTFQLEVGHTIIPTRRGHHIWGAAPDNLEVDITYKPYQFYDVKGEIRYRNCYCVIWDADKFVELAFDDPTPLPAWFIHQLLAGTPSAAKQGRAGGPKEGNRNNWLFKTAVDAYKRADIPAVEAAVRKAKEAGLSDKEISATVSSAERTAKTRRQSIPTPAGSERIIVSGKDERGLRQALGALDIEVRFEVRSALIQVKVRGEWHDLDDMWAAAIRRGIYERCGVEVVSAKRSFVEPLRFPKSKFEDYLNALVHLQRHDAFIIWLESLPDWDKTQRIASLLYDLFGAEPSMLVSWASQFLFLGSIQRAYQPGCRLDEVPVFVGDQGIGKSRLIEYLFPRDFRYWYGNSLDLGPDKKRWIEALLRRVAVEWSELSGLRGSKIEQVKAFITQVDDGQMRLAYAHYPTFMPRRCIIVATTNDENALPDDPSGNRRFVPIKFERGANVEAHLHEVREQLWAEALSMYRLGARANLDRSLLNDAAAAADKFRFRDELEVAIEGLALDGKVGHSLDDIAGLLDIDRPLSRSMQMRLSKALRNAGYRSARLVKDGQRKRLWSL